MEALNGNGMVVLLPGRNLGGLLLAIPIIADQKVVGSIEAASASAKPGDIADGLFVQGLPGTLRVNTDKMKGGFGAIFDHRQLKNMPPSSMGTATARSRISDRLAKALKSKGKAAQVRKQESGVVYDAMDQASSS